MTISASRFGSSRPRISPLPKSRSEGACTTGAAISSGHAQGGRERKGNSPGTDASDASYDIRGSVVTARDASRDAD